MSVKKVLLSLVLVAISFAAYYYLVRLFYPDLTSMGQFGDLFGGINAFFSGLAFLGVIYAILLQKEELQLQRKELELTRRELTKAAEAQTKSEKALSKQAASLKVTAKLNGKSAILQHYNTLITMTNDARYGVQSLPFNEQKQNAERVIAEIDELIKDK